MFSPNVLSIFTVIKVLAPLALSGLCYSVIAGSCCGFNRCLKLKCVGLLWDATDRRVTSMVLLSLFLPCSFCLSLFLSSLSVSLSVSFFLAVCLSALAVSLSSRSHSLSLSLLSVSLKTWQTAHLLWRRWCLGSSQPSTCWTLWPLVRGESGHCPRARSPMTCSWHTHTHTHFDTHMQQ